MGAWEEIVDYTVPSNTTSVTLNNFGTITKDDFIKVHTTIVSNVGTPEDYRLLANSSINANYHTQVIQANGSAAGGLRENLNRISRGSASSAFIYGKISENDRFNLFSNYNATQDSNVLLNFSYSTSSGATFANGITSFTLEAQVSNTLGAGSRIQIYRLAAEKVADIVVSSNTTQVDITGLDIQKGSEYLLVSDNITAVQGTPLRLFPNDLTTNTNYYTQRIFASGSSSSSIRFNENIINGGQTLNTRQLSYIHIKLSNIGAYTYQAYTVNDYGTSNVFLINNFCSSIAENITNITKLNIVARETNGIGTGSRYQLYKLY
jgi:hypothetical protein